MRTYDPAETYKAYIAHIIGLQHKIEEEEQKLFGYLE